MVGWFSFHWTRPQVLALQSCSFVSAFLSFVGSLFVIYAVLVAKPKSTINGTKWEFFPKCPKISTRSLCGKKKKPKKPSPSDPLIQAPHYTKTQKVEWDVFWLCVSHAFCSTVWMVSLSMNIVEESLNLEVACRLIGSINIYFILSGFLWTVLLATDLVYSFVYHKQDPFGDIIFPSFGFLPNYCYHIIAWGCPAVFIVWPFVQNKIGKGVWNCWIEGGTVWMYIFLGILVSTMIYCTVCYVYVLTKIATTFHSTGNFTLEHRKSVNDYKFRVTCYVFVWILTWLPPLIVDLIGEVMQEATTTIFCLAALAAFFVPANGFFDAIIYGSSSKILLMFKDHCLNCWNCTLSKTAQKRKDYVYLDSDEETYLVDM